MSYANRNSGHWTETEGLLLFSNSREVTRSMPPHTSVVRQRQVAASCPVGQACDLIHEFNYSYGNAVKRLYRFKKQRLVTNIGRGKYVLTEDAFSRLDYYGR